MKIGEAFQEASFEHRDIYQLRVRLFLKRIIDVLGSISLLFLLSPIIALTAILVKLTSAGPIIYKRKLLGLNRRHFIMYKFRTMVVNAEREEPDLMRNNKSTFTIIKFKDDPRVTSLGKILRKYSIDELPQLVNILKGEMSFVGPRPICDVETENFNDSLIKLRCSLKPGLTGLAQVKVRSKNSAVKRIKYDLEYIYNWSLLLDFRLILRTIPLILKGNGS